MDPTNLSLTAEERDLLIRLLDSALRETRVEVHHTHFSPDYRESVKHQEVLIRELLGKMQQASS